MQFSGWPRLFRSSKDARIFFIYISVVVVLFLAFVSFSRYRTVNELLIRTIYHEAQSYADLIVVTRHWNAAYGGVFVEKKNSDHVNLFLDRTGIKQEIHSTSGKTFVLKNPTAMTRELSDISVRNGLARFRMVSLNPFNPDYEPDAFEHDALKSIKAGALDRWMIDQSLPDPQFRLVRGLKVDKNCLQCHEQQGYQLGDMLGGLSVSIPAGELVRGMNQNARQKLADFLVASGLLLAILYSLTWKLLVGLEEAQQRLKHIAITDELTGLRNRRYIMEQLEKEYQRAVRSGSPLSLMILDIDHFKRINDHFGHIFGDEVLKAVSAEMEQSLRSYDLLGRIGGEEFLIASPGSSMADAASLAERIREKIKQRKIGAKPQEISVTISAGVTSLARRDAKMNALLIRADEALYEAKRKGRDRVVVI